MTAAVASRRRGSEVTRNEGWGRGFLLRRLREGKSGSSHKNSNKATSIEVGVRARYMYAKPERGVGKRKVCLCVCDGCVSCLVTGLRPSPEIKLHVEYGLRR